VSQALSTKATSGAGGEFLIVGLIRFHIFTQYEPLLTHPHGQTAFGRLGIAGGCGWSSDPRRRSPSRPSIFR
jgi:hypothetical protein